jgi:hypothetical protein
MVVVIENKNPPTLIRRIFGAAIFWFTCPAESSGFALDQVGHGDP